MSYGSMIGEELRVVRSFFVSLFLFHSLYWSTQLSKCQITGQLCQSSRARIIEIVIPRLPLTQRRKLIRDVSRKKIHGRKEQTFLFKAIFNQKKRAN